MDKNITLDILCESYLKNKFELERLNKSIEIPEFLKKEQEKIVNKRKVKKVYEINSCYIPIVKYDIIKFQVYDGRLN